VVNFSNVSSHHPSFPFEKQGAHKMQIEAKTPELAETLHAMRVLLGEGYTYVNDGRTDRGRFAEELEAHYR
jgi:hypothetical protein